MNIKVRSVLICALALMGLVALVAVVWPLQLALGGAIPGKGSAPLASIDSARAETGGAPTVVTYQGEVWASDAPYTGTGYFKFAIINPAGDITYWSNDGSSTVGDVPTATVALDVSGGLFSVLLGDTSQEGMTEPLAADVFDNPDTSLRVWFSSDSGGPFDRLEPDTRIAAVPYALQAQQAVDADMVDGYEGTALEESAEIDADIAAHTANASAHHARYTDGEAWATVLANGGAGSGLDADTVDGLHASELRTRYQNVVVVAKSGGDYTYIQPAINSITDATADNPYLVWVAPGVYSGAVTMKPYVHLQGAGQEATIISSTVSNSLIPPTAATLVLASDTSLRDLTVVNSGTGPHNVALLATGGVTRTLAAEVTSRAVGGGANNYGILLSGSGTGATLQGVTALGKNGSINNYGLYNFMDAAATLRGGSVTGRGGMAAYGLYNTGSGTRLEVESVTALGENSITNNYGLYNYHGSATLRGGSFTGRGGVNARGIHNEHLAGLRAENLTALGENATINYGLANLDNASASMNQCILSGAMSAVLDGTAASVVISHSRLSGGAVSGTPACVAVSMGGTFYANSCP